MFLRRLATVLPFRACRGAAAAVLGLLVAGSGDGYVGSMKKLLEIVLCILHPIAVVLIWVDLLRRSDLGSVAKVTWAIASLVPIVPFVYVLTGNDFI